MGAQFYTILNLLALAGSLWGVCEYVYARKHPRRHFLSALSLFLAPLVGGAVMALALIHTSGHILGLRSYDSVVLRGFGPIICLAIIVPLWKFGAWLMKRDPN